MNLGNLFGVYTLLLLNKYFFSYISKLKLRTKGDKDEEIVIEEETLEIINKNEGRSSLVTQILSWASLGTGVVVSYLTGAHAYAMQILNYLLIITANLPTFCRVGAPSVAFMLKVGKYKYDFLKGWYVLLLVYLFLEGLIFNIVLLVRSEVTMRKVQHNIWVLNMALEVTVPFLVFFFYQVAKQNRAKFISGILNFFSIQHLQHLIVDFAIEVNENG